MRDDDGEIGGEDIYSFFYYYSTVQPHLLCVERGQYKNKK